MVRKFTIFGLFVVSLLLISGCVSAPVQEMSDARQAIQAAKETGAKSAHPSLAKAESLLKAAEMALDSGEYKKAKLTATEARNEALKAQRSLP